MDPYRTPEIPEPCRHVWRVRVVHFNFGDPAVVVECSKCGVPSKFPVFHALRLGEFRAALLLAIGIEEWTL